MVSEDRQGPVDRERAEFDEAVHRLQPRELVGVSKGREESREIDRQEKEPGRGDDTRPPLGVPGRGQTHDTIVDETLFLNPVRGSRLAISSRSAHRTPRTSHRTPRTPAVDSLL